jgi:DNA-binding NarL/FixJ family response regulator
LVISMGTDSDVIQRSFESGVNGFMYKDEIDEFLVDGIRRVHKGERYLSPKARDVYRSI